MLPLNHLPRSGGDHLSSESVGSVPPAAAADPVLELLNPLLSPSSSSEASPVAGPSRWTAANVRGVRDKLESAVTHNKKRRHELLLSQFASISSHIQRGEDIRHDHTRISQALNRLSAQLDTSDPSTSFLPKTVEAVDRHFAALHRRDQARARVKALKALQKSAKEIDKLEEAVWAGRGADEWVIEQLKQSAEKGFVVEEGYDAVEGTSAMRDIKERHKLLKNMVVEQVTDAFGKAVSFHSEPRRVVAHSRISLQQPRMPRSVSTSENNKSSIPPPYPLTHIYTTLNSLSSLLPLLNNLKSRLLKELILPLVQNPPHYKLSSTPGDQQSSLTLDTTQPRSPSDVLGDISTMLGFIASSIFPSSSPDLADARTNFLTDLHSATWKAALDHLIVSNLPSTLSGVQSWLDLLDQAADMEDSTRPGTTSSKGIVRTFLDNEAGTSWANGRRYRVAEEVRRLVLGGWGGWEGMEVEVEKEITVVTEVEVEEPPEETKFPVEPAKLEEGRGDGGADFGWGFDDDPPPKPSEEPAPIKDEPMNGKVPEAASSETVEEEEGWGFDEPDPSVVAPQPVQEPAAPAAPTPESPTEGDGWDFDLPAPGPSASTSMPPPPVPAKALKKPVREAKKLGKAVAKAKAAAEESQSEFSDDLERENSTPSRRDSMFSDKGSGSVGGGGGVAGMLDSLLGDTIRSVRSGSHNSQRPSISSIPPPPKDATEDGWGWDDAPAPPVASSSTPPSSQLTRQRGVDPSINALAAKQVSKKRFVRKEETRKVKEKMTVSRACEKLLEITERVVRECEELQASSFPDSFTPARGIVQRSIGDAFDLYRGLIATHYAVQLREVPVLAMQVANDHAHLATSIERLPSGASLGMEVITTRLRGAGEGVYETSLEVQQESLITTLNEGNVTQVGTEAGFKVAEKAVKQVVHNLESLGRVLKPVIAPSTYFPTLGYLLDCVLYYLTAEILSMVDITEMESNRLNELLKMIHPLEEMFADAQTGQVRVVEYVKGWLRFCYISELLVASLVDITYLFETGALIDFTTAELVGLIRALFADSPKRDAAIDKIEKGLPGQMVQSAS